MASFTDKVNLSLSVKRIDLNHTHSRILVFLTENHTVNRMPVFLTKNHNVSRILVFSTYSHHWSFAWSFQLKMQ